MKVDSTLIEKSDLESKIDLAFDFVKARLFSPKTSLIYDHIISGREHEFPTLMEISSIYPNPCGYSTGMEDGILSCGTMLDACLIQYERYKTPYTAEFAKELVFGMLNCASSSRTEGFLPRAVSTVDNKSHYPDSSRDQYTLFAFGMHRYLNSDLCTEEERQKISEIAQGIARRAERNVTPENGYDMLTDDSGPTLNTILWGNTLGNHEYLRLPMLYLFAYEASGDTYWYEKYKEIRDYAYRNSLPMTEYWALYTLSQMQASILLCYDVEEDACWKKQYLLLMNKVADYAESTVPKLRMQVEKYSNYNAHQVSFREIKGMPAQRFINLGYKDALTIERSDSIEYFALQDCAHLLITIALVPNRCVSNDAILLFTDAFSKIDLSIHERNLPVYFIDGYYRGIQ